MSASKKFMHEAYELFEYADANESKPKMMILGSSYRDEVVRKWRSQVQSPIAEITLLRQNSNAYIPKKQTNS